MSQLLIIDVQNTYKDHFGGDLLSDILEKSKNFNSIVYLWDDISGQDLNDEIPFEFMEDEKFYDSLNIINKQYAFFRGLMDSGIPDEDIVHLAKYMIGNKITDAREVYDLEDFKDEFEGTTIEDVDFEDYSFHIPYDLIESLSTYVKNGVVVGGGGLNECLKEVCILLDIIGIEYSIDYSITY